MTDKYSIMGNGKILCYGESLNILSIQGDCYTSPPFCSLFYDGDCTCVSVRSEGMNVHTLYSPNKTRTANIRDYVYTKKPVFVREFEAYSEITFKLVVPPYVRKYEYEKYDITDIKRPAFILDIPFGTPFGYGCITEKDKRMLIVSCGNIKFIDDTTFKIGRGKSKLIFAAGSPPDAVNAARYALKENTETKPSDCIKHIHSHIPISDREDINIILHKAVETLAMLQGADGGIITSCAETQCDIETLLCASRAFCAVGLHKRAANALKYVLDVFEQSNDIILVSGVSNKSGRVSARSFKSPICCRIINAFFAYFYSSGNSAFIENNKDFLEKLMATSEKELYHFMLPFSCGEHIDNVYPIYQGSTRNTLEFVKAAENMSKYFDARRYSEQAATVVRKLREYSYTDGVLYANYPNRVLSLKQSRFVYGKCISCAEKEKPLYIRTLEKSRTGYYLCPDCSADKDNGKKIFFDPYEKYISVRTIFDAVVSGCIFSEKEAYDLVNKYVDEFVSSDFRIFCGREGNTSLSDLCAMLSAASTVHHPQSHSIARVISTLISGNGIFQEYNANKNGCGIPSVSSDCAELILAFMRYLNLSKVGL